MSLCDGEIEFSCNWCLVRFCKCGMSLIDGTELSLINNTLRRQKLGGELPYIENGEGI
jgi:hypothetical protein